MRPRTELSATRIRHPSSISDKSYILNLITTLFCTKYRVSGDRELLRYILHTQYSRGTPQKSSWLTIVPILIYHPHPPPTTHPPRQPPHYLPAQDSQPHRLIIKHHYTYLNKLLLILPLQQRTKTQKTFLYLPHPRLPPSVADVGIAPQTRRTKKILTRVRGTRRTL